MAMMRSHIARLLVGYLIKWMPIPGSLVPNDTRGVS